MKKLLALLLVCATLFTLASSLTSCSKYEPQESTEEESAVVMTMSFDGVEYEVKYELYRALFLNNKEKVDGGDESVWTGADKQTYIDKINKIITDEASKIFAAIYVCNVAVGFDVYSSAADELVEKYVEESVDGSEDALGFETYEKYLSHLKSVNLNYSVQGLMYRYYIALDKISEYYAGNEESAKSEDDIVYPTIEAPVDKIREFYYSDSLKHILYAYFSIKGETSESVRKSLVSAAKDGVDAVKAVIGGQTATPGAEIDYGLFIPLHAFNNELIASISDTSFTLESGSVSEVLKVSSTGEGTLDGQYILYALEKSEADFEKYFSFVRNAYLEDLMGQRLTAHAESFAKSVKYTQSYSGINHSAISM